MNGTKFFIYARKSTDDKDRQVRSIDDQLAEVRELASRRGLHVVDVLLEKQSAKKPGRPVFNEMLTRIERGEANGILAWHPDRLARNMLDGGRIIHLLDTGVLSDLKFPTIDFQPNSQGKLTLAMLFGMSKYYVDNLSENIRRGQRQKVRNGIWPMVAPVGYVNDRSTRTIVIDPVAGPLVRKAFELHATGNYTLDRLTDTVNAMGLVSHQRTYRGKPCKGRALTRPQYHRMLQNPIYYGVISYGGELHEGKHQPLISKQLFEQVQAVMSRKSKPKSPALKSYLYRGMFRCGECGCFITTETQKGHNYVHCTKRVKRDCSQPFMREEALARQVTDAIRSVALPSDWADWMVRELQADQQCAEHSTAALTEDLNEQIGAAELRLERLMTAFVEGAIGLDEYRQAKNKIVEQKQELTARTAALSKNSDERFEPAIRFVKAAKSAAFLADSGTDAEKRDFLKKSGSNLKITDRRLSFVPRGAWAILTKTLVDSGRFAQPEPRAAVTAARGVGESGPNFAGFSEMRRGGDSNSRYRCRYTGFRNRRIQPLCHLSLVVWGRACYRWSLGASKGAAGALWDALCDRWLKCSGPGVVRR